MNDENPYVVGPSPYNEERLRRMYYDEGMTLEEMAKELGYSLTTVVSWMDDFGLEREPGGPMPSVLDENPYVVGPSPYNEERLRRMYYDEGMTLEQMADELDRNIQTVSGWMNDFGIGVDE